ncbi:MAG: helix-turn-helix domain-containing protein [Oligoflexia bacterium]|nr:helix-turn-helix domain-containing protein [Oligoflexia bacterium]
MRKSKKNPIDRIPIATGSSSDDYHLNQIWMTTKEAASYLRISTHALFNEGTRGRIVPYKLGRRNRYLKKDLDDMLVNQSRNGVKHGYSI